MIVDLQRRWLTDAACRSMPNDLFFYDTNVRLTEPPTRKALEAWAEAKAVCETCPVLRQCARDSIGEPDGVWGGMDPLQRHRVRASNSARVRKLPREEKREYALLARQLTERRDNIQDTARRLGLTTGTIGYLKDWLKEDETSPAAVAVAVAAEAESKELVKELVARRTGGATLKEIVSDTGLTMHRVRKILHDADPELLSLRGGTGPFPRRPPENGDGWVRYGGTFVDAAYVGQTEDGEWFQMRMNLYQGNSTGWFRKRDVALCRNVVRTVKNRLGTNGSRIYATPLNHHAPKQQAG